MAIPSLRRGVLANRAFRRLIGSYLVSKSGDFLYNTALVVVVLQRTGSAGWVAAALIIRLLPSVLLTPLAGVVADRMDRRHLMVSADVLRAAFMSVAAVIVLAHAPIWAVLLVAFLSTCAGTPFLSAMFASLPEAVPEDQLASANALIGGVEYAAILIGPLSAAAILWAGYEALPFAINAGTFAVSALLLSGIRLPSNQAFAEDGGESFWQASVSGLRVFGQERLVKITTVALAAITFTYGVEVVLMPLVSKDRIGTGTSGLGVLDAAVGVGGVAGTVLAARLARSDRLLAVLGVGAVGCGLPMALLSLVHTPVLAYALLLIEGGAAVTMDVVSLTVFQRVVPVSKLARIDGLLSSIAVIALMLGNLAAPAFLSAVSLRGALIAGGGVSIVVGMLVLVAEAGRRLPAAEPELADLLRALDATRDLPEPALEALASAAASPESVPAGRLLLRRGEQATEVLILVSGDCEVLAGAGSAADSVINGLSGPDLIGEIGVLHVRPRTASVQTVTGCVIRRVPGDAFLAAINPSGARTSLTSSIERRLARWPG